MDKKTKNKISPPDNSERPRVARPSRRELVRGIVRYLAAGGLVVGGLLMGRRAASFGGTCPVPACGGCPEFTGCRRPQAQRIRRSKLKR